MKILRNVTVTMVTLLSINCFGDSASIPDGAASGGGSWNGSTPSSCAKALDDFKKWTTQFDLEKHGIYQPFLGTNKSYFTGEKVNNLGPQKDKNIIVINRTTKEFPHSVTTFSYNLQNKEPTITMIEINGESIEIHTNNGCAVMMESSKGSSTGKFGCNIENLKAVRYQKFGKGDGWFVDQRPSHSSNDHELRKNLAEISKKYKRIKELGLLSLDKKPLRSRNLKACALSGSVSGIDLVAEYNQMFPSSTGPGIGGSSDGGNRTITSTQR